MTELDSSLRCEDRSRIGGSRAQLGCRCSGGHVELDGQVIQVGGELAYELGLERMQAA